MRATSKGSAIATPMGPLTAEAEPAFARATMRRVSVRLLPLLFGLFVVNYIDRSNLAMAALGGMSRDLGLSATAYSLGASIFFIGYAVFEVPSNLILARVGARRWIARIVISWGVVASAMMFVRTPFQFYALRFLLGIAEAGFFPGIVYYLSLWFPTRERARALSRFVIAVPLAAVVGNPVAGWLLGLEGRLGLHGWQWVFLVEGIPSVLLGVVTLALLTDHVEDASWLSAEQRAWLVARLTRESTERAATNARTSAVHGLVHPVVWLACLMYFLHTVGFYGYIYWSPLVVQDALHTSPMMTGWITAAMGFAAMIGILVVGVSSDRTGERGFHMFGAYMLAALGYLGAALLPLPIGRVASLTFVLMGSLSWAVLLWCLPPMLLRGRAAAAGIALINSLGNLGGFAGPTLIGRVKDTTGGTAGAFIALAFVGLVVAVLSLVLWRRTVFALRDRDGGVEPPLDVAFVGGDA